MTVLGQSGIPQYALHHFFEVRTLLAKSDESGDRVIAKGILDREKPKKNSKNRFLIQKWFLDAKNTKNRVFLLFLAFFGPRIGKSRTNSILRGYDFEHPLIGYLEIIWTRSEDLSLDKRLRSPKNPKRGEKWEKWAPFLVHFLDFFSSSWSHVTLFFRVGKKGTQNGSSGVWSHFCYTEKGQKWTNFGAIFELRGLKIEVENEKTQKKITFFVIFGFLSLWRLATGETSQRLISGGLLYPNRQAILSRFQVL